MPKSETLPRFWVYLSVLLSIYILTISGQTLVRTRRILAEQQDTQHRLLQEKKRNETLNRQMKVLHTDDYLENLARQKLGLVKSGEVVYKIVKNQK